MSEDNAPGSPFFPEEDSSLVYTYTSAPLEILKSGFVRCSSFENVNDPRESKKWALEEGPNDFRLMDHDQIISLGMSDEFGSLRSQSRLACFTQDRMQTGSGRSLMHKGWARPRMWSQYGVARIPVEYPELPEKSHVAFPHAGACLIFDRDQLVSSLPKIEYLDWYYDSVEYRDLSIKPQDIIALTHTRARRLKIQPLLGDEEKKEEEEEGWGEEVEKEKTVSDRVAREQLRRVFFTKSLDWASEDEWRILGIYHVTLDASKRQSAIKIPLFNSLRAIVLGEDTKTYYPNYAELVSCAGRYLDYPLLECSWGLNGPNLFPI